MFGSALWHCGSSNGTADAGTSSRQDFFIARQTDFKDFRSWQRFTVHEAVDAGTPFTDAGVSDGGADPNALGPHPSGDRYAYVNRLPPHGATAFPTGTIILKIALNADGSENARLHAMVKRNGGFNADGAVGWEWMELVLPPGGAPVILWRDSIPPSGEGYDDPLGVTGDCNTCHETARENDYVQGTALQLKDF